MGPSGVETMDTTAMGMETTWGHSGDDIGMTWGQWGQCGDNGDQVGTTKSQKMQ